MKAVLQFLDYHVLESCYRYNPFSDEDSFELSPEFDYAIKLDKDNPSDALVELGITIGDEHITELPLYVRGRIVGRFELKTDSTLSKDDISNFLQVNAVAILYPYLRSLISDVTSKGSEAPVILPTINVVEMMKKKGDAKQNQEEGLVE